MHKHDIIVIGASAGGMEALKQLVAELPEDLPASVFVVWHIAAQSRNILAEILDRDSRLPVTAAVDNERIRTGHVYVAPSDRHLILEPGRVRVTRGPKENRFRPTVDVLFRSAALHYGPRVIGVVLTGMLDDGASGLIAIKQRCGKAVVQDPREALYPSMPVKAMKAVGEGLTDYCVPVAEMPGVLMGLAEQPAERDEADSVSDLMKMEVKVALEDNAFESGILKFGEMTNYTCPECHGSLKQLMEGNIVRFRCHTGHAYTLDTLLAEVTEGIEEAVWSVMRGMEESTLLIGHMADHLRRQGDEEMAERFEREGEEVVKRTDLIRKAVMTHEVLSEEKLRYNGDKP